MNWIVYFKIGFEAISSFWASPNLVWPIKTETNSLNASIGVLFNLLDYIRAAD